MEDKLYPARINGFRFLVLSDQYPEHTFRSDAVVSAAPSTRPTTHAPAPREIRYSGMSGKTIWLLRSVNKLTSPTMRRFLVSPLKKEFLFIEYDLIVEFFDFFLCLF